MSRKLGWLLNLLYLAALVLFSPLLVWKAATTGKYREGFAAKFLGLVPQRTGNGPGIWLHAVSVGEVNLLETTRRELLQRRPDAEVVISTSTKTGYDLACRKYGEQHTVFYCPLDFTWAVRAAMRRVRPDLLVLAELELWPNLIAAAKQAGVPVAIINGRLSDGSFCGYRRIGWLVRRVLRQVDLIAAQDVITGERFSQLRGSSNGIVVTGSLKYDGAETNRHNSKTATLRELAGITDNDVIWLAGSTQAPEEAMALASFGELRGDYPQLKLILVPRHPERFDEVALLLQQSGSRQQSGLAWRRRSELESTVDAEQWDVLLVDSVGELGAWWGTAQIGLVGGSFGDRGGQNMIEPAAYGVATCFGPNTKNFRDVVASLLAADGARVVADQQELQRFVTRCLEEPSFAAELGQRGRNFVATQLGATTRTVDLLLPLLPEQATRNPAAA